MKKETSSLFVLTALMVFAIMSHVVHNEPVAKFKEPLKFAVFKDWTETVKGHKLKYLNHLYTSAE